MEVEAAESGTSKDVEGEVRKEAGESQGDESQEPETNSRPTTPSMPIFDILPKNEDEWWRPTVPPETWKFEEIRRQRQKGGYPWTHLDKEDTDVEADQDYLDDNLYEPVNPPSLYATGSSSAVKDPLETGSLDGRRFEIPPEIDIITSDGLDGLDLPDRHCFDGDKEWVHSDEEPSTSISVPPKALFTAGIRPGEAKASEGADTPQSSNRPLTNKSISFAPEAEEREDGQPMEEDFHEVPSGSSHAAAQATGAVPKKTTTAFEILKSKAAGAADSVKQRFKIGLPTRQKLSKEEGAKLRRRPRKKVAGELDQEVPEEMEVKEEEEGEVEVMEQEEPPATSDTTDMETAEVGEEEASSKEAKAEAARIEKEAKEEASRKEKEAKEEEKLRKKKEEEELKRQKAEEKQQAKEEAARKKAEEKLAKQKAADEAKKAAEEAKKAKLEEQLAKAKEAQELKRQKEEEELKKIREQEAVAKELQEKKRVEDEQRKLREEEEAKVKAEEAKVKAEEAKVKAAEGEEKRQQDEAQRKLKQEDIQRRIKEQEAETAAATAAALAAAALYAQSQKPAPAEAEAATVSVEVSESAGPQEEVGMEEEPAEASSTPTSPTGTAKRKVKKMTFPQLPHLPKMPDLPHIDLDFRKKIIKRSKTPPGRPQPPKGKGKGASAVLDTENQLAAQYENEILARNAEMEEEEGTAEGGGATGQEPQIYVTQPSTEPLEESDKTHVEWEPSSPGGGDAEEEPSTSKKAAGGKERLDKFGKSLKGKSKAMGQKMKVIGKDLQKFGVKVNEKYQSTIEEIKAKQEAAKARSKEKKAREAEEAEEEPMEFEGEEYPEGSTEPRRTFRFRRRDESQEESEDAEVKPTAYYENSEDLRAQGEGDVQDESKMTRSQLLGRADRDWESPLDLAHSRDVSEEPFSGNASSRDSPPGSSMASSTFAHVRKQGVLEEIDSDEFFLREKGISEGEDGEEINRFLVEELRQAFRPQGTNALAGFDLPESPDRPERSPRKPPRKEKDEKTSPTSYQTFPPERPRRKAPGYVSAYMNQEDEEEDGDSQVEERGSQPDDLADYDEDGMRLLKEDVQLMSRELEERHVGTNEGYEDDGRYEPINEEPVKPLRVKKTRNPAAPPLYYNTVAGNEWMRDLEDQVELPEETSTSPRPPQRERRKSARSAQFSELSETPAVDELHGGSQQALRGAESESRFTASEADADDGFEYVDEAGYAVVHKERGDAPRTAPRRKKKSGGSRGSLKRRTPEKSEDARGEEPTFFSLPRQPPKTFHVTPPSRPQRNYSTLRPRRPPRNKSKSPRAERRNKTPEGLGGGADSSRPSTAIGIMQGRPLPPPPRPERSPIPMNDLDMSSIERAVGARHYANFDDGSEVVEETCTATKIPHLGRTAGGVADDDVTVGIQTDLQEEPAGSEARSVATDSSRVQRQSDSLKTTTTAASDDRATRTERPRSPVPPRETPPQPQSPPPQFVFPTRLRLQELEVDVLRVNDLTATSINVDNLTGSQIQVTSLTATGSLSVASIHTQTLNSDVVNCNRLSSDTVDLPSIPPASFAQLSSPEDEPPPLQPPPPSQDGTEPPEELRLTAAEKEDAENESSFPYVEREEYGNNLNRDQVKEEPSDKYDESALIGDISEGELLEETPEGDDFAQYTAQESSAVEGMKSEEGGVGEDLNIPVDELPVERETFRSSALINEGFLESPEVDFSSVKETEKFASEPEFCTTPNISLEEEILEANIQISYTLPNENVQRTVEGSVAEEEPLAASSTLAIEPFGEDEEESVVQVKVTLKDLIEQRRPSSPLRTQTSGQTEEPEIEEIAVTSSRRVLREPSPPTPVLQVQMPVARVAPPPPAAAVPTLPPRQPTPPRAQPATTTLRQSEPEDILQLGIRLGRALTRLTMRGLQAMIDYVDTATSDDPSKAEQQKANLQVLLCVILMLVAALMLTTRSGPSFNRWEFYMPPPTEL